MGSQDLLDTSYRGWWCVSSGSAASDVCSSSVRQATHSGPILYLICECRWCTQALWTQQRPISRKLALWRMTCAATLLTTCWIWSSARLMLMLQSWLSALLGESHWHNVSVSSIKQACKQARNQSVSQSIKQAIKQTINQTAKQSSTLAVASQLLQFEVCKPA